MSERELEILQFLADGLKNCEIAAKLFLSEGSVRNYISSIYSKLNVENRASDVKKFRMAQ
ncbi:response regulator transcription factor [Cohnella pontilimi]|uniref:Response regulator transcription factor n=1 Tax=Cohnella pontilimi TaxID=2564100 RepID=A0A4U0FDA4_9BACL|nr:LuxR C-terminal-related transcriptional regulator [Cohnella pontilimi]TJY42234.1 response regulator transcription factor [Cohnella pontilimi]